MKKQTLLQNRQPGDIVLMRSMSPIGLLMRILQMFRSNISFSSTWSHIQIAYDENRDLSAVAGGIKFIDATYIKKGAEARVFRFKLTGEQKEKLKSTMRNQIGKKYAYARHWLDFFTICIPIAFIFTVLTTLPAWLFGVGVFQNIWWFMMGLLAFSCFMSIILRFPDRRGMDCSESVETVLVEAGIIQPFAGSPRAASPTVQHYLLMNMAELIVEGKLNA